MAGEADSMAGNRRTTCSRYRTAAGGTAKAGAETPRRQTGLRGLLIRSDRLKAKERQGEKDAFVRFLH